MVSRTEIRTVSAVTVGGFLEWYEFSLFAYLAPIFAETFFPSPSVTLSILNILFIFAIGFLSRPVGAIIFGYIGDHFGRRIALLASIIMITIPTIVIGLLPSQEKIGIFAPIVLLFMRLLQGVLVGGEVPGSMCYLVEMAIPARRRLISSWAFFGSQIGGILAIAELTYLQNHFTSQELLNWGWRISFLSGGALGLVACFLRYGLKETVIFQELSKERRIFKNPIRETLRHHKRTLFEGFCISAFPHTAYFLFFVFSPIYFEHVLNMSFQKSLLTAGSLLALSTIFLPIFGTLKNKYESRKLLLFTSLGVVLLSYPFYFAAAYLPLEFFLVIGVLVSLLLTCFFSCFSQYISEIFPATIRYSSMGLSYNLSSSVFGGITPFLALYLIQKTKTPLMPSLIVMVAGIFTVVTLHLRKGRKHFT